MNVPTRKLSCDFELPVLGLGTWQMGGRETPSYDQDDQDIQAIRVAIERGVTHIDTAEQYGGGHTEELIRQAIAGINRSSIQITSKVSRWNLGDVRTHLESSLKRLQTEYLDLYLIHSPSDEVPLEQTLAEFDQAVDEGLIRWIGVSNFSKERLMQARDIARHPIVLNQVYYNVRSRGAETTGLLEYCQNNEVVLEAYRPTDKSVLLDNPPKIIRELAEKYQKTPVQIMLNWLIAQRKVTTLIKTSSASHLKENLGAVGWTMDASDVVRIQTDYPNQETISETFPPR